MNVATRLKLEQMEKDTAEALRRVSALEQMVKQMYADLHAPKPASRETLTLEKRKSA